MRKYARVDSNQSEIVKALRKIGCSVQSLADVGNGCPDLLVGYHGDNFVIEVKRHDGPPSAKRLTDDEAEWQARWVGNVVTVDSAQAAINYVLASGR